MSAHLDSGFYLEQFMVLPLDQKDPWPVLPLCSEKRAAILSMWVEAFKLLWGGKKLKLV